MPVLEAILVALLILTAILFVTSVQRPLKGSEAGGVDLSRLAGQTLGLLRGHEFKIGTDTYDFEAWVNATLEGNDQVTDNVTDYLTDVLPPGTQYSLGLSNGYGVMRLVPTESPGLPSNARWAEIPFFPHWNGSVDEAEPLQPGIDNLWLAPGMDITATHSFHLDMATVAPCIKGPNNETTGPGGMAWTEYWQDAQDPLNLQVPLSAPFGLWAIHLDPQCDDIAETPTYARVALRDGTISDHHIYGLRLVVWFGA